MLQRDFFPCTSDACNMQGVPLPVVFALLDQGLEVLQPLFTSHSVSIATMSHDKQLYKLKTFSRHFSSADHFLATTDIPAILRY